MAISVNWKYSKSFISVSGSATIRGTIQNLGMNIVMAKLVENQFVIPQILVQDTNVQMDKGGFDVSLHCSGCPGEVEKWISDYMKDDLLNEIHDQIQAQIPAQANSIGNAILTKSYPRTIALYNNIDIATALTDAIVVEDDHLEVFIDATVFPSEEGYKRPEEAKVIPHYNPKDPGEIMVFLSEYLVDTLSVTLGKGVQTYNLTIMGIAYQVSIDPDVGATSLSFEEGDFILKMSPSIVAPTFGVGLQFGASMKLNPTISSGDAKNMMSVTPTIKEMSLSSINVTIGETTFDISAVTDYLNGFIKGFLNAFVIPKIPVKKQPVLPLYVTNSELDFHPDYSELGLLFKFGME